MKPRTVRNATLMTAAAVFLLCLCQSFGVRDVSAQTTQGAQAPSSTGTAAGTPQFDPYDRVALLWYRQRLAPSGAARGEEIFYMSCWMCHNEYTVATTQIHAPLLADLFKPGSTVTDEAISGMIRRGGIRMPAYPPNLLSDQDVRDVIAFLRAKCAASASEGGSCYDEMNPPANPRYKAQ
jgi:cytochrome c5